MKRIFSLSVAVLSLLCTCAAPIRQFYPGTYFPQDRTYQNKAIGFSLTFQGNWDITTDPNEMSTNKENAKELHTSGAELLFIGSTVEGTQGTRGIVFNFNETIKKYAEEIQRVNKDLSDTDYGLSDVTIHDVPMVRWEYAKGEYRFVEFFFSIDTYNLRVAFWTKPRLYENFLPVYEDIMSTLTIHDSH
jgi:hypothetical protein